MYKRITDLTPEQQRETDLSYAIIIGVLLAVVVAVCAALSAVKYWIGS